MNPTDYQIAAARTLPTPGALTATLLSAQAADPRTIPLLMAILGLAGEIGEWLAELEGQDTRKQWKEAGDVLWYCAAILTICGRSMGDLPKLSTADVWPPRETAKTAPLLASELVKKAAFHKKKVDADALVGIVAIVVACVDVVHSSPARPALPEIMAENDDKLRKRWPDGFGVGG